MNDGAYWIKNSSEILNLPKDMTYTAQGNNQSGTIVDILGASYFTV